MDGELIGREEVAPPLAFEHPAPGEPSNDERRHHGLTHIPFPAADMKHDHKPNQAHESSNSGPIRTILRTHPK